MESKPNSLSEMMQELALSVPETQKEIDLNFAKDLACFKNVFPKLEAILGEAALDLHPRRMLVKSINLTGRFQISVDRENNRRINLAPVNSSHSVCYSSTKVSTVALEVVQVPVSLSHSTGKRESTKKISGEKQ